MGASSNLFLMLQEQEVRSKNFLPNKKEVQFSAKQFVEKTLENGEVDKVEMFTQALRLCEALEVVRDKLKDSLPMENFEAFGVKGAYRSGGYNINYSEDEIYATLKKELDERAEQLKMAQKQPTFDAYGNKVPKVSKTPRKSSLAIIF
jgi:hypothetical protein